MCDRERGRKEAEEAQSEIVIGERKRRSRRIRPWYLRVDGDDFLSHKLRQR